MGLAACHPFVRFPRPTLWTPPHWLKQLQGDGVQVIQIGSHVKLIIPSDKIFIFNSACILSSSCNCQIFDDVAGFIKSYGTPRAIIISGFTDNIGPPVKNLIRSEKQAKSVLANLWSRGIPSSTMIAVGYGEHHPIADNNDAIGMGWNRRIEIQWETRIED